MIAMAVAGSVKARSLELVQKSDTDLTFLWDANVVGSALTHCCTILAPEDFHIFKVQLAFLWLGKYFLSYYSHGFLFSYCQSHQRFQWKITTGSKMLGEPLLVCALLLELGQVLERGRIVTPVFSN